MKAVRCSECGKSLRHMGDVFGPGTTVIGDRGMLEQWLGNVCLNCKLVFCADCIKVGGPTPCPRCGQPTMPAQRVHLEEIGVI
jgi:hypothetical protein